MKFTGLVLTAVILSAVACSSGPAAPGEDAFSGANSLISIHDKQTAFGNGPEAEKLAERFASMMKVMRKVAFTESKGSGPSMTDGEFLTYCQLTDEGILFLVHVPELRNFKEDAQASLLELGWVIAQTTTKSVRGDRDVKLGVGLRGALLYGGQAIGLARSEKPEKQDTSTPVDLEEFYPFFVGAYPATVTAAAAPAKEPAPAAATAAATPAAAPPAAAAPAARRSRD